MSEASVHTARAVVYVVDPNTKSWAPIDSGFTRLDIYVHSGTGNARVIGRSMEDPNKILVNSNISKETMYTKARDTFHQWSDSRGAYGLNFGTAPEADAFAANFENSKNGLGAAAAQPQPPAPKPAPPPKPAAPVAPTPAPAQPKPAPPAPKGAPPPPAPPKAPPKPPPAPAAASSSSAPPAASGERNALLDSIQGFSKGGLKKAVTVDKSAPIVSNKPAAGAPSGNSLTRKEAASAAPGASPAAAAPAPAASGGNDMMAEMLRKREAMKSKQAAEPAAHKPAAALKPAAAPTPAAIARPPSQQMKPNPPPAGNKPTMGLQTAGSFGHGGASAVAGGGGGGASGASAPPATGNGGAELPEHLQALKEAIMTEIRAELAQFKLEILESLQQR